MIKYNGYNLIPFYTVTSGSTVINVPAFVQYYSAAKPIYEFRGGSSYYQGQIAAGAFMCHPQKVNKGWAWKTSTSESANQWILNSFTGLYRGTLSNCPTITKSGSTISGIRCIYSDNMVQPYVQHVTNVGLNSSYDVTYSTSNALRITFGSAYTNKYAMMRVFAWYLIQVSGSASFSNLRCNIKSKKNGGTVSEELVELTGTEINKLYDANNNQLWSVKVETNLKISSPYSSQYSDYLNSINYIDMPRLYVALTSTNATGSIIGWGMELWPARTFQ